MKNPLLVSMFAYCTRPVAAALLLMLQLPVAAVHAGQLSEWYLQRLFEPTDQQLAMEARGRVQIYSGMKDTDVLRALDEQFQRIDSMMFTGTIVTDPDGAAVKDPETGEVLVENDGC